MFAVKVKGKEIYFEGVNDKGDSYKVTFDTKSEAEELATICTMDSDKGYIYEAVRL